MNLSLSELAAAVESSSIPDNGHQQLPLCENIFDVPRCDLFETYERLRQAFWTEQRPPVIIIKHALSEPEPKRPTTRKEEEAKPDKTKPIAVQQQKKPVRAPTTTTTTAATTLWDIKKSLIRQLRGDLARYDEKQVLDQLADCDSRCSRIEKRHLAQYLMPVIEATRRRSRNISQVLEKWLQ